MQILKHLLRTLLLITGSAAFLALAIGIAIGLGFRSPYVFFGLIGVWIWALVYGTARWHPYWAPIAKQVSRFPWSHEDGTAMETIVEKAVVQGGEREHQYLRVSINEVGSGKCVQRRVLGDSVIYLGAFQSGLWFYINDRFYARRDGLVCLDRNNCEWTFHQPQSRVRLIDDAKCKHGQLAVEWDGVPLQIDLVNDPPVSNTAKF